MRKRFLAGMLCVSMVVCSINLAGSAFAKSGAKLTRKILLLKRENHTSLRLRSILVK